MAQGILLAVLLALTAPLAVYPPAGDTPHHACRVHLAKLTYATLFVDGADEHTRAGLLALLAEANEALQRLDATGAMDAIAAYQRQVEGARGAGLLAGRDAQDLLVGSSEVARCTGLTAKGKSYPLPSDLR